MKDAIAAMMDCGVCVAPGTFAVQSRPRPDAAPEGWVLVDIAAIGICGTDYHIFEGKHPFLELPARHRARAVGPHRQRGRRAKASWSW